MSSKHPRKKKVRRLVKYKSKFLISESPYAVKFEDRSPGETEIQERCARGDAWEFAKKILQLKKGRQSYILFTL